MSAWVRVRLFKKAGCLSYLPLGFHLPIRVEHIGSVCESVHVSSAAQNNWIGHTYTDTHTHTGGLTVASLIATPQSGKIRLLTSLNL